MLAKAQTESRERYGRYGYGADSLAYSIMKLWKEKYQIVEETVVRTVSYASGDTENVIRPCDFVRWRRWTVFSV